MPCCSCISSTSKPKVVICSQCNEDIETSGSHLICVQCLVAMHRDCYKKTQASDKYTYCENCKRVGSIGSV